MRSSINEIISFSRHPLSLSLFVLSCLTFGLNVCLAVSFVFSFRFLYVYIFSFLFSSLLSSFLIGLLFSSLSSLHFLVFLFFSSFLLFINKTYNDSDDDVDKYEDNDEKTRTTALKITMISHLEKGQQNTSKFSFASHGTVTTRCPFSLQSCRELFLSVT